MNTLESTPPEPPQPSHPPDPPDPLPEEPGPITVPPNETTPHDAPPGGAVASAETPLPGTHPVPLGEIDPDEPPTRGPKEEAPGADEDIDGGPRPRPAKIASTDAPGG